MGFIYNLPFLVLLSVGTALWVAPGHRGGVAADLVDRADPILGPLFAFFGLPASPPRPVVAAAFGAAGATGLVLCAVAHILFGSLSPWLALNALATALAVGVLTAKLTRSRHGGPPNVEDGHRA